MFVGGLSWETTEDGLRGYFSKYGEISDSVVMRDSSTGRSRGFGFVTFTNTSATAAVLAETHTLDGKTIDPKLAVPREHKPSPLGSDFRTKKLFVGGVAPTTTDDLLKRYFEKYGKVVEALLMTDRDTGRPRGFGFVTFESEDAADAACEQKFHEIDGKPVRTHFNSPSSACLTLPQSVEVKKAEPKSSRSRMEQRSTANRRSSGGQQEFAYMPQQTTAYISGVAGPPPGFAYPASYVNASFGYPTAAATRSNYSNGTGRGYSGRSGYGYLAPAGAPMGGQYDAAGAGATAYVIPGYGSAARAGAAYPAVYDDYFTAGEMAGDNRFPAGAYGVPQATFAQPMEYTQRPRSYQQPFASRS